FHLTQPDPSGIGPRQAMERALQSAQVSADSVDYINAHGTATPFNDAAEGKAIGELFGRVPISSTKSMMGHSLGAAGAIEAIICLLALQNPRWAGWRLIHVCVAPARFRASPPQQVCRHCRLQGSKWSRRMRNEWPSSSQSRMAA